MPGQTPVRVLMVTLMRPIWIVLPIPRAQVSLLVSLGGGFRLLRYALQRMRADGWYRFVVCQATLAAVGFYERIGFRRVGAVARYAPQGTTEQELRALPVTGYQHWVDADELMAEADFGSASYLMALDLHAYDAGPPLELPVTADYPRCTSTAGASDLRRMSQCMLEGGHLAYESGDGIVVSLMAESASGALGTAGRLDDAQLRMEIRYEVCTRTPDRPLPRSCSLVIRPSHCPCHRA